MKDATANISLAFKCIPHRANGNVIDAFIGDDGCQSYIVLIKQFGDHVSTNSNKGVNLENEYEKIHVHLNFLKK